MRLTLTDDQTLLAKTAAGFVANRSPMARAHGLRHGKDPLGYSRDLWREMATLGWTGIPFPENDGGLGLGMAEMVIVTEALGRCLVPEPLVPVVMLAGQALTFAGSEAQRAEWLKAIIGGDAVVAFARQEANVRYEPTRVSTTAQKTPTGYRLTGEKVQVAAGHGADAFVVTTRTSGQPSDPAGLTLFLVPAATRGLETVRQHLVDSRNAAIVKMKNVDLPDSAVVGRVDQGADVLDDVLDRAATAAAGEMLGAMTEAFERTLAFLKERVQFGVVIGTFQALKHRVARLFIEIELARSAVLAAARAIDEGDEARAALTSNALSRCVDAYRLIANEAIQLHGGIGMTDEHEIGLFIKHAAVASTAFGDARYHRDRFARLCGY